MIQRRRSVLPALTVVAMAWLFIVLPTQAAPQEMQRLGADAQRDLEASLAELTQLREEIAAEKLPLSKELGRLESRLADLRRDAERLSRETDTGTLDLANRRTELKLRQDEVAYLGNLLEEFRANFESRVHSSELQRYEPILRAAKSATDDASLSVSDKFDLKLAVVKTSIVRLEKALGGERFDGKAVDPQGALQDGRFALIGPVALFASRDGKTAGVAVAQTGSSTPAVRPLGDLTAGAARVVSEGRGSLPLDPTRGAALKALIQRTSLIHLFLKGGPIMWPLLFASILALGTVAERFAFLMSENRHRDEHTLQEMLDAVETGDVDGALRIGKASRYFVCRALTYALEHRQKSISNALMLAQSLEIKRMSRGIPILDTVITLAPLLGLLGTVTGMMSSFSLIGGELSAPSAITGGIAEALIATAFGLGIAIMALIPFNYLNSRVEGARHELDAAATRLELLLQPHRETLSLPAAAAS
jgi:biopolymer transport protein ExbB